MKLPAFILVGSLAANAALLAVYFSHRASPTAAASTDTPPLTTATAPSGQTAAPAAASGTSNSPATDPKTWARLRSGDLRALAARLREAGFPPSQIRAVIAAQVNDQLRAKYGEAFAQIEQKPFWATENGFGGFDPKTLALFREMNRESNRLLREALGPDFPTDPDITKSQQQRFGSLSPEKIDQLQRVADDYDDLRQQTTAATRGLMLPEDREKLALLEKEKRADLAKILSPSELEDYLMRTSQTTMQLRTALTAFNASESEFRAIYQAKAAFDEKYSFQNMGNFLGGDAMKERTAAQARVAEQLKAALGETRYAEYARSSDREYQAISRLAQQANLPATAAVQAYNLRDNASKESNRIFADAALSTDQKRAALATLAQTTRTQLTATLGADAGSTYVKLANTWLSRIEQGAAVTFTENGSTTRNLPRTQPAGTTPPPTFPALPKTGG